MTGASSGLGETFARKLAARGHDLVLVARREDRLHALAEELHERHRIRAGVLAADLATADGLALVEARVRQIDNLRVLVNNAGFGIGGRFIDGPIDRHLDMIHVHVLATVRLTRAALDGMLQRGRGYVINVSSMAAFLASAGRVTYCATKVYVKSFTESLAVELHGTGVRVQALCPGFVYTGFHDTPALASFDRAQIPRFLWMSSEEVVETSLAALERNRVVCVPGFWYRLLVFLLGGRLTGPIVRAWTRRGFKR